MSNLATPVPLSLFFLFGASFLGSTFCTTLIIFRTCPPAPAEPAPAEPAPAPDPLFGLVRGGGGSTTWWLWEAVALLAPARPAAGTGQGRVAALRAPCHPLHSLECHQTG